MTQDSTTPNRKAIRKILERHRGSKKAIADSLGINPINVSQFLRGISRSQRVSDACIAKAKELLKLEEETRIAKGLANGPSARAVLDTYQAVKNSSKDSKKQQQEKNCTMSDGHQMRITQSAETMRKSVASESPDHIMPGLIEPLVEAFLTPRQHYTTRGVKRRKGVTETVINSALFHFILGSQKALQARVDRIEARTDAASVRDSIHLMRRSA